MKQKHTVLIRTYHLIEVEEEELIKDDGLVDGVIRMISCDKELPLGEPVHMKWEGTDAVPLLPELTNCGRCASCGMWTTDREKDDPVMGLTNGATVEGQLLCEECLPKDHRWAF